MTTFHNVTVFGTGVLGSQIIMQAAYHGKNVVAYDVTHEVLDRLPDRWDWMRPLYLREVEGYTEEQFEAALGRITTSTDVAEAVADTDLVIEAIPEDIDLKKQVWSQIGTAAPEKTVFTTNTSTLRPSDFAEATGRPEKFLALHFANRVWSSNIGEVMKTDRTDLRHFEDVVRFATEIGLEPVRILKEQPGYVLNSLFVPWLEAGLKLYMRGIAAPEDVDKDWRISTGSPLGPFQAYDVVGFNVAALVTRANNKDSPMHQEFATLLEESARTGRSGVADGEGFYVYDAEGSIVGPSEHFSIRP